MNNSLFLKARLQGRFSPVNTSTTCADAKKAIRQKAIKKVNLIFIVEH